MGVFWTFWPTGERAVGWGAWYAWRTAAEGTIGRPLSFAAAMA